MRLLLMFGFASLCVVLSGCSNPGLGEAGCTMPGDDVSAANVLNVQAVPTAKFTPCVHELRLGWDSVDHFAEDGRAGIRIERSLKTFLTATVTETCDISGSTEVDSSRPDVRRYQDVDFEPAEVVIPIIPSAEDPLLWSRQVVHQNEDSQLNDRPLRFALDDNTSQSVSARADRAFRDHPHVLIVDEVDAEEGTVQLRSTNPLIGGSGLTPREALARIENNLTEVYYRGSWYFTFDGGCITYEFDATGPLAETVAEDTEDALGFFRADELRRFAREQGYEIE